MDSDRRPTGVDALVDAIAGDRPDWWTDAACRGFPVDWWFPDNTNTHATAICGDCPVAPQCLEYALTHREPHGIWGGVSALRRKRMRRDLRTQQ